MDGMHDLGGKQGFGKVDYSINDVSYHHEWELRAHALSAFGRKLGLYNMDEYRHAVERMQPRHYLGATYYERVLTACATLYVEKGMLARQSLEHHAGGVFPLSRPTGPGRGNDPTSRMWNVGAKVRVRDLYVPGHVRMPGYVRGRVGVITGISPPTHFADSAGHNMPAALEPAYSVCFRSKELWGESCDDIGVYVDLFQSYLEDAA